MQIARNLCRFFVGISAAILAATALAVPNPTPTLALRDKAPEVWVVEVQEVKRPADARGVTHTVQVQMVVKSVERTLSSAREGDALCLRYSAFNPDYKDPVPIGVYYTGLLKAKTSYKVWLVAPKQTGECYTPAADWASFEAVK